jgi:glucose-fructose oxidoreductase
MTSSRRRFLQDSLTATAGLAISPFSHIIKPVMKEKLGVALVGLGSYSTHQLAPALQQTKYCYLAGIVTGSPGKIDTWQNRYRIPDKNVYTYNEIPRIADNPDIDVLYIVLPPSMHSEYCVYAASAGKHVWCEKPMAITAAECKAAIDACKSNKVSLAVGYRMQHEANTQKVIAFGKNKTYGKIQHVNVAAGYFEIRTGHWRLEKEMGGGAMFDMGVYSLNAARYCTGEEPTEVSATQSTDRPKMFNEVDEHTNFELRFPSGATASCATSFGKGLNDLKVTCSNGWYQLSPFQSYNGVRGTTSDGQKLAPSDLNQQAKQMDDDAFAILNNKPLIVPGEEGMRDIHIVEKIFESAKQQGEWVKI